MLKAHQVDPIGREYLDITTAVAKLISRAMISEENFIPHIVTVDKSSFLRLEFLPEFAERDVACKKAIEPILFSEDVGTKFGDGLGHNSWFGFGGPVGIPTVYQLERFVHFRK